MPDFIAPSFKAPAFNCPHCGAYSAQFWYDLRPENDAAAGAWLRTKSYDGIGSIAVSECLLCHKYALWIGESMFLPDTSILPQPNADMPEDVKELYREAARVFHISPRSSAALLRVALQRLTIDLGERGQRLNDDIGSLVKKGLPSIVQEALDDIRGIGNEAAHPASIDFNETPDKAAALFTILNLIVQHMITIPASVRDIYSTLPKGVLESIKHRDQK